MSIRKPPRRGSEERNRIATQWLYLPRFVANRLTRLARVARVIRSQADFEDLVAAGWLALLSAAALWDETRSRFSTYAVHHIRLAQLSHVNDTGLIHLPESVCGAQRQEWQTHLQTQQLTWDLEAPEPETDIEQRDVNALLAPLGEEDREILRLSIFEGLSGTEIGRLFGVSRQRIWQRRKNALGQLRKTWQEGPKRMQAQTPRIECTATGRPE